MRSFRFDMFKKVLFGFFCFVFISSGPANQQTDEIYDILIINGKVLDGSGNPWFYADIAINGDEIVKIGQLPDATAKRTIDAAGLYVTPGFIDVHSHAGPGLGTPRLSYGKPLLVQGVTTVFINPDGGGSVNIKGQREKLLEDGLGLNVAQFVPHGSVRRMVLGMDDRAPTADEMEEMKNLVKKGMEEGAFGLSSGPFYVPGSYSTTEELIELSRVASEYGGAYESHIRDESNYTIGLEAAVDEVIEIAREAKLPGVVTHIKALGPPVWGLSETIVKNIENARAEGVEVFADQYPYLASATGLIPALIPRWAEEGGHAELVKRLEDPEMLSKILSAMEENLTRRGGADRIQFRFYSPDSSIEGKTLQQVADEHQLFPLDMAVELIKKGSPGIVSFNMNEDDVYRFMNQIWTMTSSDGGLVQLGHGVPHPRNYGTFPHKIREYGLEKNVIDLEFAIRSMTSLPARVFDLTDRGQIREGAKADIAIFDVNQVTDHATFREPHQYSEGMQYVLVNGELAIEDGEVTDNRGGKVLFHQ